MTFKRWEKVMIVAALLVFVLSFLMLQSDRKLYPLIFNLKDWRSVPIKVGSIALPMGDVKRQSELSTLFKPAKDKEEIYNHDYIFTDQNSGVRLLIDDGSVVDLGPNTMIRISVDSLFGFSGLFRNVNLNVVMGKVAVKADSLKFNVRSQGRSEKIEVSQKQQKTFDVANVPFIKPVDHYESLPLTGSKNNTRSNEIITPQNGQPLQVVNKDSSTLIKVSILSPLNFSVLQLPEFSEKLEFPLVIQAQFDVPPEQEASSLKLFLTLIGQNEPIVDKMINVQKNSYSLKTILKKPGTYRLQLGSEQISFELKEDFHGITLNPAKIGGVPLEKAKSEIYLSENYDVNLSWKPLQNVKEYKILFADPANPDKVIRTEINKTNSYSFNSGKLFQGSFLYQVTAVEESGFISTSNWDLFQFALKSPVLTAPKNETLFKHHAKVELVWSKSSFSNIYDIEIFEDSKLTKPIFKQRTSNNFYYFRTERKGQFFWRTRAISKTEEGPYSQIGSFLIQ